MKLTPGDDADNDADGSKRSTRNDSNVNAFFRTRCNDRRLSFLEQRVPEFKRCEDSQSDSGFLAHEVAVFDVEGSHNCLLSPVVSLTSATRVQTSIPNFVSSLEEDIQNIIIR